MSNLKIRFSPEFFSAEHQRNDDEVISNNDIVCQHLSSVYANAVKMLNQKQIFDEEDEREIARGDSYAFIGGGSIENARKTLAKKGVRFYHEKSDILALTLQGKIGMQFRLGGQMSTAVMLLSNVEARMAPTEDIKTTVHHNRWTRTTTIKYQSDIFTLNSNTNKDGRDIGTKIGVGEASVSFNHKTKELKLNKFDITIYSGRPEQKTFKTQAACFSSDSKSQVRRDADKIKTPKEAILKANKKGFFAWIGSLFTRTKTILIKPAILKKDEAKQDGITKATKLLVEAKDANVNDVTAELSSRPASPVQGEGVPVYKGKSSFEESRMEENRRMTQMLVAKEQERMKREQEKTLREHQDRINETRERIARVEDFFEGNRRAAKPSA
jgi:hypothetical protein